MWADKLHKFLSDITPLTKEFEDSLEQHLHLEIFKARQIIHAAGQLDNRIYFMVSGFARNYYFDSHGNEHTVRFWQPGEIIFSYEGYYNVPSCFYTEIREESKLITLSYLNLHQLDSKYSEVAVLIKFMLLKYQSEENEKQKLIDLPVEERYQIIRKNKPHLFQKLPTRILASYLHMGRETLTRLIAKR
ncbi:Crp/Fnr family transcriptional regulator [Mucilaginibacter lappiensis]|uniref:Crp/Fnr family transcriptional regulator n=1 Tax=Mucilaginibacter lappiensis TaxID=354630 RepID=UPI003D22AE8C